MYHIVARVFFITCYDILMNNSGENIIKVSSVSAARRKHFRDTNKHIQKHGELLWLAALVTAYQNGGYDELKRNYEKVPLKYLQLLLEAYQFKNTEREFSMAQAVARPHMKKGDAKKYMQELANKLEGKD